MKYLKKEVLLKLYPALNIIGERLKVKKIFSLNLIVFVKSCPGPIIIEKNVTKTPIIMQRPLSCK